MHDYRRIPDAFVSWSHLLEIDNRSADRFVQSLPFVPEDAAAGVENELQAVVAGTSQSVDLPIAIRESGFFQNLEKRVNSEECSEKPVTELKRFLDQNPDHVWENSWVRFPENRMNRYAQNVFQTDMLSDKSRPESPVRCDVNRFFFFQNQEKWLRIPISYLIKLGLADFIGHYQDSIPLIYRIGEAILPHFLSDNTSPETFSFQPVPMRTETGMGAAVARETLHRHLLTHLIIEYANRRFMLTANGQKAGIHFAPNPPFRLKELNSLIPDSFYRQLFMNPCLSGWDQGENKHHYMHLCHQVLSRSQLNAVSKLRDAGIIQSNLVVLPNLSNISLANNGTHISLSSQKLMNRFTNPESGFKAPEEKYFGDLAIKIVEHFLPLFVNTYSAAPYRLDFQDFHPEKALGFLPHELDFTHLRMLWRRWKKKARLKILGYPVTPLGPEWLDSWISRIFGLKGDMIPDFRLIDYLVSLLSTNESPALNGQEGNDILLKRDLTDMGVFDSRMALYLFYRMRQYPVHGFCGFEGRYYSLFPEIQADMGQAASLQLLITALACKYIISHRVVHPSIPDTPFVESERRQIVFGSAIGIPTFFVKKDTPNAFMRFILKDVERTRTSSRYAGYVRIHNLEYKKALIRIIQRDAADLIELMQLTPVIHDLKERVNDPEKSSASHRLHHQILAHAGASNSFKLNAGEFNRAAGSFYRNTLRNRHLHEAIASGIDACLGLGAASEKNAGLKHAVEKILNQMSLSHFLATIPNKILEDRTDMKELETMIGLMMLMIGHASNQERK
ncbi:MAG: hypothetical protein WA151_03990 [Desulfatirhabdiaceae bacterium]